MGSHITSNTIMGLVNEGTPCCCYVDKQIPPEVEKAGKAVLKAFETICHFFHLVFRFTPTKPVWSRRETSWP